MADVWLTMMDLTEKKYTGVDVSKIKTGTQMGERCNSCPWGFRCHPIVQGTGVVLCTLDFMRFMGLSFGLEEIA